MVQAAPDLPLTDNCHHYTRLQDVPKDIQKYWKGRYKIFPNYNDGIYLTDDAWFGVTPEPVARKIAGDTWLPSANTVVDMFAGAGGNTIAFALWGFFDHVIGIERNADTLACAQENARVAGVPEGVITWIHGDCFEVLKELLAGPGERTPEEVSLEEGTIEPLDPTRTVLFASPPWGGVSYTAQEVFDLSTMEPYNLQALHDACYPLPHALYLPRTSDLQQLADVLPPPKTKSRDAVDGTDGTTQEAEPELRVVQYCMHGFSKALVAYYPAAEELYSMAQAPE
ncbi:putative diacylglycerol O-acyltransferase tgs1 [Sporothrix eucalyptigena]|uniref:Trimethylguanosine synthase n=1 Tax=Sporothrix eucalyptigena TaxID=1812306 RepID=A0ABP0D0P4_9PEZI